MTTKPTGAGGIHGKIVKIDYATDRAVQLITAYGGNWDWYQAVICPCVANTQSGARFTTLVCDLCNGSGWAYIFVKNIKGIGSSVNKHESTLPYRVPDIGQTANITASLTVEPTNKVNIRDRLVFKDSTTFLSESAIMEGGKVEYKFLHPMISLQHVIDIKGNSYDCTNELTERRDVVLNSNGRLEWVAGKNKPASGDAFSVLYEYNPSYLVIDIPHSQRGFMAGGVKPEDTQVWENMPRLLRIKIEIPSKYLFGNNEK